jgi:secondary thiamine-phosphate synthase enzyme
MQVIMVCMRTIRVETRGKGVYELTEEVERLVADSGVQQGLVNIFNKHTSSSLVLMENADPTACRDLEAYFDRLVPENLPYFKHIYEGPDDMPSHIRMVLTRSSETVPVSDGRMMLGIWQGIFLFEHRRARHHREIVVTVYG